MTCKIKRRSLRCGGRPKADFGSLFTSVIAPALNATGSIVDESIDNNKTTTNGVVNSNTTIPSDPTKTPTMRLGGRKKCWIGATIGAATSIAGSLFGNSAKKREMRRQKSIQDWQNTTQEAANMTAALNNSQDYQEDYLRQFRTAARLGKTLGAKGIYITDGGDATKIGNNTYLLRGGSHEDVNETGQTGIGINVGGNEVEAEGGEVAQKKNGALRIFSAQPILGNGMSPAQAILRGYNKDSVFSQQQAFKKRNGLKDDGSKAAFGNLITMPFAGIVKDVVDYFTNSGKYASKRIKVSNKTVNRKPIRNGQVGNFRIVNGKYFPNEKPLRQVYPEFDIISMGRGLPIKRSLKNTVGFIQKPNTFTRGIGNSEGIKDLVESKVVRGNPVGTEMTAKAYTKATKSNRNSFNDIMNGTGRKGISHRYYNRSLSKEDFDAIRESYNKINASFKARHPKASGKIRFAIGDDIYDPLGNYKNYDDYLAQIASDRKTLRNATTINPDNGEPIAYFYDDGRNPLTQGHDYASSKWGVRISNPKDYNMKIFDGHLHYSNSKTIPFDSPNVEVFRSTPFGTIRYPKWMLRRGWYRNGGLTSKDRGSSKHPYPSVSSKDFAGGGRSYPIPTKADAVDALRLAGLHGRSDVRSKVYSKYSELRKKARGGTKVEPYYDWAKNTSSNLGISFIDPTYDYRTYYNSVTPYERNLIRFAPQGTHFTDIGKTPKHPTFSNESIYSNKKHPGGTWNGNVFVPNIWQFGNNGNKVRNKYMNNSGEGYFNGRVNVFPKYRKKADFGTWVRSLLNNNNITPRKTVHFYKSKSGKVFKTIREAAQDNYNYNNNPSYRISIKGEKYNKFLSSKPDITIPYIKSKAVTLNKAGKATGARVSTNQLDSIAKYANRAGLSIPIALGLVMKETTFNNLTPYGRQIIQNENIESMPSWSWVNNHHWSYWRNPYREAIEAALRNTKNKTTKDINNQLANGEKYADKLAKDLKTQPFITGIEDGFRKYKTNPYNYNPGQKNYVQLVNQNSRDIMNSPQIQQWYKTSPYIKGRKYKCGGRISLRPKAAIGIYTPFNKRYTSIYDAPDYDSDYNGGNVLGNGEVTVTAKRIKPTFMKPNNDAMNIINHPANEAPYIPQRHNRSRTIFSGGDYLGLGIDTLAALSTGLVNYNTAGKYVLPDRAPIIQASKLPTTYNVNPEIEEVKRYRDRLTGQTFNNTSSSVAALNRSNAINLDALSNLSKLWATKENEENKMLTEDAKNQQTVAAQNVQNELARQSEIARIKNEAIQAKGDALNVGLSGLSQAWTNFWTAGRTAYEDDQSRRAMIASSKDATPTRLMEMDFDLSPDVIAALYRTSNEDRTKRFYLSRLSPKQRQKYGIN